MRRRIGVGLLVGAAVLVVVALAGGRGGVVTPYRAPEFAKDPRMWVNSGPLQPGDGRVFLVEVWSYG
jgi:hypothetical protein